MNDRQKFILDWANSNTEYLTSYNMHPKVIQYGEMFYNELKNERKIIQNLTYNFRKLVCLGVLENPICYGLGFDSKNDFFGTTRQYNWKINKKRLLLELNIQNYEAK